MQKTPKTGYKGLVENWKSDLIAALSVALVALPLALGIAEASNVEPITGIISCVIGGIVTTFFRGSHLAINGPAAGLIAVILSSLALWGDDPYAFNYVLAAIAISGLLQIILGILKLGKFAEIFHSSVIQGIMAAIGVIIFAKQIHSAMGISTEKEGVISLIKDAFFQIPNINPFVGAISLAGLLLLIFHSKISYKLFHLIPAPMWVLVIAIPFVYAFNFFDEHNLSFFGKNYTVGPELLISIPDNILDAIEYPVFTQIGTWKFWSSVILITMIASIQSLAMGKAVDKLDPFKRKTNLNKDLIGIGMSTMVAGAIGGLPIITVIVRSTVNINNNAKTKWSNLYHGILLLAFIFVLTPLITKVPLAALAILLVFTGYKLASPVVFRNVLDQGIEQLIFFIGTLIITLQYDLLIGIFGGLALAALTHFLLAKVTIRQFIQMIFNSGSNLHFRENIGYEMKVKGIANFLGAIKMNSLLDKIPAGSNVNIDLSGARLVDFSIMEKLYDFQKNHANTGGEAKIVGLEKHISSTNHRLGLKLLTSSTRQLTNRQLKLKKQAEKNNWNFSLESNEDVNYFNSFTFFKSRPVEEKLNSVSGKTDDANWEIIDIVFEEGAFLALEEYQTTIGVIHLPLAIPKFTIEKKDFINKYLNLSEYQEKQHTLYHDFSSEYTVKVNNQSEMKNFMNDELKQLILAMDLHHLESNGEAILIFTNDLRFAPIREMSKIVQFKEALKSIIKNG
ncbi:MAG: SulP family inorganic anion transporter [Saprospiraceae bacterium]|nr:SulP family inorganic anion transporter [Saprospiraceae bacterium]MDG2419658.1 SulP family inorganic anion transporter [Saprospiraceae bacterium]